MLNKQKGRWEEWNVKWPDSLWNQSGRNKKKHSIYLQHREKWCSLRVKTGIPDPWTSYPYPTHTRGYGSGRVYPRVDPHTSTAHAHCCAGRPPPACPWLSCITKMDLPSLQLHCSMLTQKPGVAEYHVRFLHLWHWPWLDDLHIRTWPDYSEDVAVHQKELL